MFIKRTHTALLFLLAGLLTPFILPASAPCQTRVYVEPQAPQPEPRQGSRFVRSNDGRDYYVDSKGALHLITRQVIESPGAAGGLYYIEDDERPYSRDQGDRLYYRDSSGRTYYIEDVRPGRPGETIVIQHGSGMYAPMAQARSYESCESQWQTCMSGCNGISTRQKYDRPNCVSNCDVIRSGCRNP